MWLVGVVRHQEQHCFLRLCADFGDCNPERRFDVKSCLTPNHVAVRSLWNPDDLEAACTCSVLEKYIAFFGAFTCDFSAICGPAHYFLFNLECVFASLEEGSSFFFISFFLFVLFCSLAGFEV